MRNLALTFVCSVMIALNAFAQAPLTDLYQYNYTSINPAFAGLDGQKVTLMGNYLKFNTGNTTITSGFVGYEINAEKINSGFGFTMNHQALGPSSDTFINLLYNYQFKINDKSKLVIGAKFSDYIYGVDFSQFHVIDPNDPLLGGGQPVTTNTMLYGLGALYKTDRFFIGVSTDNAAVSQIKESSQVVVDAKDKMFHYMAGVNFKMTEWLSSEHSVYGLTVADYWRADLNNTFTFVDWVILGVGVQKDKENKDVIGKLNAGIKIKDRGKVVVQFYSNNDPYPNKFKMQAMVQFRLN